MEWIDEETLIVGSDWLLKSHSLVSHAHERNKNPHREVKESNQHGGRGCTLDCYDHVGSWVGGAPQDLILETQRECSFEKVR